MSVEEVLLKPFRIKTDKVMMATDVFLFLVTLLIGFIYDGLLFSVTVGLPPVLIPFFIWRTAPGTLLSRLAIASAFVIQIAIQIQLSHGLIELHFGLFVILAFLLAYRDWRTITFAAALIAVHHLACNFLQAAAFNVWVFRNGADFSIVMIHAPTPSELTQCSNALFAFTLLEPPAEPDTRLALPPVCKPGFAQETNVKAVSNKVIFLCLIIIIKIPETQRIYICQILQYKV